jgi:hypothetical protein
MPVKTSAVIRPLVLNQETGMAIAFSGYVLDSV